MTAPLLISHRAQSSLSEGATDSQAYVRNLMQSVDERQAQREALVDARQVLFASAASADHRPRIAASEAFDTAAAALPRPPNWCYVTISVDYAAMLDTPQVIWHSLCKANGVAADDAKANAQLSMVGGVVCQQHPGGGYVQVMLGCIPDLQVDAFTFDLMPEQTELYDPDRPPPALCLAMLDARLCLRYERVLAQRIGLLSQRLSPECALVGGVYPSIRTAAAPLSSAAGQSVEEEERSGLDSRPESGARTDATLDDSIFFINDRVYRGSAGVVVMRSRLLRAHRVSVVPSIGVGSATLGDTVARQTDGTVTVPTLNGQRATAVIQQTYCSSLLSEKTTCKVFLGVTQGRTDETTAPTDSSAVAGSPTPEEDSRAGVCVVPVAFSGNPASGELHCTPHPVW